MEANALGELEAEYELRLNNQRQGGRGQVQQFNMEQQAVNMNEFNSEIKAKLDELLADDRALLRSFHEQRRNGRRKAA